MILTVEFAQLPMPRGGAVACPVVDLIVNSIDEAPLRCLIDTGARLSSAGAAKRMPIPTTTRPSPQSPGHRGGIAGHALRLNQPVQAAREQLDPEQARHAWTKAS